MKMHDVPAGRRLMDVMKHLPRTVGFSANAKMQYVRAVCENVETAGRQKNAHTNRPLGVHSRRTSRRGFLSGYHSARLGKSLRKINVLTVSCKMIMVHG